MSGVRPTIAGFARRDGHVDTSRDMSSGEAPLEPSWRAETVRGRSLPISNLPSTARGYEGITGSGAAAQGPLRRRHDLQEQQRRQEGT